ncbi:MAG: zinc ribbon domain-containing protein [Planctomycetaceae bacterium]|nr:zinc ribbon domain-containing protein [Planctomycetaceae bacterium]
MSFPPQDFDCPCCGAEVSGNARFCRECGASGDSGWNLEEEEGFADDDDFDYDDFLEREFGTERPKTQREKIQRAVTVVIIVLVCISLTILSILGM